MEQPKKKKAHVWKSEESKARQMATAFGGVRSNPMCNINVARDQRNFYSWAEQVATKEELQAYAKDESKPIARRKFIIALMKCEKVQDFFDLTNQTHGAPKQVVEMQEVPKIDITIIGGE